MDIKVKKVIVVIFGDDNTTLINQTLVRIQSIILIVFESKLIDYTLTHWHGKFD